MSPLEVAILITWLGQAGFVLEVPHVTILTDPMEPRIGYAAPPVKADIVTISHEHGDHNCLDEARGTPTVLRGLTDEGADWNLLEFSNPNVRIKAFGTYHDAEKGAQRGRNAMFLFEIAGVRILHTGDLGHLLDAETLAALGRVDVLMICVGGHYTIDAEQAREVTRKIQPRVVIPMHYKTDRTPRLPIQGVEPFLEGWEHVQRAEKATFSLKSDLSQFPEGRTTVLVLPYLEEDYNPEEE